jgi:hypothetical protein
VQPQQHLLFVALCIESQQPSQHVIPHVIGPAGEPGQFAAAADRALGLQLALEIEGVAGIPEEQLAAIDVLFQLVGELGVVFGVAAGRCILHIFRQVVLAEAEHHATFGGFG